MSAGVYKKPEHKCSTCTGIWRACFGDLSVYNFKADILKENITQNLQQSFSTTNIYDVYDVQHQTKINGYIRKLATHTHTHKYTHLPTYVTIDTQHAHHKESLTRSGESMIL